MTKRAPAFRRGISPLKQKVEKMKRSYNMIAALLMTMAIGCGPAKVERIVNIGASDTAFVVNLEDGPSSQDKMNSLSYLEEKKVGAKQITILQKQHNFGYGFGAYKYIPGTRVIVVNRAPVTRDWTPETKPLEVESLDQINFSLGATTQARIDEADAALYLSHYGSEPSKDEQNKDVLYEARSLASVVDSNVRSYCQSRLFYYFGSQTLEEDKGKKAEFFNIVEQEVKTYFKGRGITIDSFGPKGGMHYVNKDIRDALSNNYIAESDQNVAEQERLAAVPQNEQMVSNAIARREAAEKFLSAKDAILMTYQMEIQQTLAEARVARAKKWDGNMPANLLPSGGQGPQILLPVEKK